jgi:hypothetical protein
MCQASGSEIAHEGLWRLRWIVRLQLNHCGLGNGFFLPVSRRLNLILGDALGNQKFPDAAITWLYPNENKTPKEFGSLSPKVWVLKGAADHRSRIGTRRHG